MIPNYYNQYGKPNTPTLTPDININSIANLIEF